MAVDTERPEGGQRGKGSLRDKRSKLEEEFCSVTRRSGKKPTEMGEGFELETGVSCGSGNHRW